MSEFSDSSVSRTSPIPGGDLQVKYQRIAAEYSKIRAQATVLKKAVVEEQGKNIELHERLREKEQSLRKTDQEIESLTFRNQQLTKRVAFLQDELDSCQNKKVAKKSLSSQKPNEQTSSNVLDLEFKKMVEENAQLLSKMYDSEEEHKQEMGVLNEQIDKLQKELDQYSKANSLAEEKFKATILKLEREKGELYETIKLHEQHLKSLTEELVNLNKFKLETVPQLEAALLIIATYLPFIDTSNPKLKCTSSNEQTSHISIKREVENLALYFMLFFSSLKKRLHLLHPSLMRDVPASEFNTSLSSDLAGERASDLVYVLSPLFLKFSKHSKSLLPLFLQSLSEEEKEPWCNLELRKTNQDLSKAVLQFMQFFMKISSFLESSGGQVTTVNQTLMRFLFSALQSLEECSKIFAIKEQIEKNILLDNKMNFDLLSVQSDLQVTNVNCVHLLANLASSLGSLLSLLQDQNPADVPEDLASEFKKRLNNRDSEGELKSNIASLKGIINSEDDAVWKNLLLKQLEEAQKIITQLEKDQIKIKNELNVLKLKGEPVPTLPEYDPKQFPESDLVGKTEPPLIVPAEVIAREEQLKNYFTEEMNCLVVKNQEALSKANAFSIECGALQRRLEISSEARRESEKKLNECNDKVSELNEKLQLTKQSYETQLSTMSDHLANLNDKLAGQTDQLEQFKMQLNNARRKK